jgi:hypothetical protein
MLSKYEQVPDAHCRLLLCCSSQPIHAERMPGGTAQCMHFRIVAVYLQELHWHHALSLPPAPAPAVVQRYGMGQGRCSHHSSSCGGASMHAQLGQQQRGVSAGPPRATLPGLPSLSSLLQSPMHEIGPLAGCCCGNLAGQCGWHMLTHWHIVMLQSRARCVQQSTQLEVSSGCCWCVCSRYQADAGVTDAAVRTVLCGKDSAFVGNDPDLEGPGQH